MSKGKEGAPVLKQEKELPNYEEQSMTKSENWLGAQVPVETSEGTDTATKSDKIEKLLVETEAAYPPPEKEVPFSTNRLKNPEAGLPISIYRGQSFGAKTLEFLNKAKKKIPILVGFLALGFGAKASGTSAENTFKDSTSTRGVKIENNIKNVNEKIEIKIANYFETDKADISKENATEISKLVSTYINNLNERNVDQFINSEPALNVSCDPRPTNSYENGNDGLALARANETQRIIREMVANFDFSKLGLTSEQIKIVINKFNNLKFNIPPGGVIDYHLVINPETKSPFTDAEWSDLLKPENKTKLDKAYQDMRYVNMELVLLNKESNEIDPYFGFAKNGTVVYNPNGQMTAKIFYATKNAKAETDGGMLNTKEQDALIEFFTKDGVSLGKYIVIPGDEFSKITGGTHNFKSQEDIDKLIAKAKDKDKNYTITSKDLIR